MDEYGLLHRRRCSAAELYQAAKLFCKHIKDLYSHVRIRYRTPTQLGLLERFHQTLKNEDVYWRLYDNPLHASQCLEEFRLRNNRIRPHWALMPEQVA